MAQVLSLCAPTQASPQPHRISSSTQPSSTRSQLSASTQSSLVNYGWASLQQSLKCKGRISCLFSDNNKQEQAKKALEGALGGKKIEFEKWDKEIKKREESGGGGGGSGGGGGWFGWGRWFGDSDGDRFWPEAQQTSLTILGILVIYLIIAKGDVMLAVIFNPLLYGLRGTRNGLAFVSSQVMKVVNPNGHSSFSNIPPVEVPSQVSAKESVARKWGSE